MTDIGRELVNRAGLVIHEHEDAVGKPVELLGHGIHPNPPAIRLQASRVWKLGAAVQHMLRRRNVSGRAVEVIVGHFTYAFLLNRCLLPVLSTAYKFIRNAYVEVVKLWPSVSSEFENTVALFLLQP